MKKGFTLIELLVVISIIGILAALTLTGFNAARKNARDATRKSDLQQYRNALEAYASNNGGKYPTNIYSGHSNENEGIFSNPGPLIPNYLPSIIHDPLENCSGGTWMYCYAYVGAPDGLQYVLGVALETEGGTKQWEICSNGKAGKVVASGNYVCDLP